MREIIRTEIDNEWAHSAVVEAGDYVYISYCMKNEGQSIENQINGAFDVLSKRLETIGLTLKSVVQMDCLFKDIKDLSFLGEIIKERFEGEYDNYTSGKYQNNKEVQPSLLFKDFV